MRFLHPVLSLCSLSSSTLQLSGLTTSFAVLNGHVANRAPIVVRIFFAFLTSTLRGRGCVFGPSDFANYLFEELPSDTQPCESTVERTLAFVKYQPLLLLYSSQSRASARSSEVTKIKNATAADG